jgi:hypothetical protein
MYVCVFLSHTHTFVLSLSLSFSSLLFSIRRASKINEIDGISTVADWIDVEKFERKEEEEGEKKKDKKSRPPPQKKPTHDKPLRKANRSSN